MNRIFIKCPTTGKLINTGFAMDVATFEASPIEQNAVACPACGKTHAGKKRDAILESDQPRAPG